MKRVLIVDDEERMQELLKLYLTPHRYVCDSASTAGDALELLKRSAYDLALLDVMMPGISGWELCQVIREQYKIPVIMITARSAKEDIVKGFKLGSDDYIIKPFDEDVLIARIDAVLRRSIPQTTATTTNESFVIDEESHEITYKGISIPLTAKEFNLIHLLAKHPKRVYKREQLMDIIWGYDTDTEDRTIDSHIRNIREKFRKAGFPIDEYLKTIWGIGYRWEKEVAK
ncbi:DNA-binding response regulator [Desulfuribacillus stibiiarsenatis]|uniref:DNA-binding response regulator n=1 Tax=Desulfuribacillus stibiiarsenatis TaxID=1390249 RepID=A0A1E5L311_9FIRM|nr:response regulator transcription factor [Desulfuribacillus stibiiarsenatis]OEH84528.1 DNA-binding response regulator [Desulfuribacillus stibiiarsenatis]